LKGSLCGEGESHKCKKCDGSGSCDDNNGAPCGVDSSGNLPFTYCKSCSGGDCLPDNEGSACNVIIDPNPCQRKCDSNGNCINANADEGEPCADDFSACKVCDSQGNCNPASDGASCGVTWFDDACAKCDNGECDTISTDGNPCGVGDNLLCKKCFAGKCEIKSMVSCALDEESSGSQCKICSEAGQCEIKNEGGVCYPENRGLNGNPCGRTCDSNGVCTSNQASTGTACANYGCMRCEYGGCTKVQPEGTACEGYMMHPVCATCDEGGGCVYNDGEICEYYGEYDCDVCERGTCRRGSMVECGYPIIA